MKSFTKPILFGVLAVSVSASGYGNEAVNTPCSSATPVTPQYQTSEVPPPPVYTAPTTVVPPPVYTAPTTVVPPPSYSTPEPPASSAPPEVTCPYTYATSCAFLCKGSSGVAYCAASDLTDAGSYTSCTVCPGAPAPSTQTSVIPPPYTQPSSVPAYTPPAYTPPAYTPPASTAPVYTPPAYTPPPHTEPSPVPPTTLSTVTPPSPSPETTCPYTYSASCAYLCKGGSQQINYCSDKDVSSDYGKITCTACPGAPIPPNNGTSVPTYPPSTPTYTPPVPTNATTPYPTPTYNSGASALNIGTAVVFGMICIMFTL